MSLTNELSCETMQKEATTSHIQVRKQPDSGMAQKGEEGKSSFSGRLPSSSTSMFRDFPPITVHTPDELLKAVTKNKGKIIKVEDRPTGAEMFNKTRRVKDMVKEIYELYPSTRGDDRLLIKRYLDRFCPQVRLSAVQFEALRSIPSFESIRRRGQELRVAHPELQPRERTKQKRMRREHAFRNYYGKGELKLTDFIA